MATQLPASVQRCIDHRIPIMSASIRWEEKVAAEGTRTGRKKPIFPKGWGTLTADTFMAQLDLSAPAFALLTGEKSGVLVVDADTKKEGVAVPAEFEATFERESNFVVDTTHGRHYYFTADGPSGALKTSDGAWRRGSAGEPFAKERGVDIRAEGGCIFMEGSTYRIPGQAPGYYRVVKGSLADIGRMPDVCFALLSHADNLRGPALAAVAAAAGAGAGAGTDAGAGTGAGIGAPAAPTANRKRKAKTTRKTAATTATAAVVPDEADGETATAMADAASEDAEYGGTEVGDMPPRERASLCVRMMTLPVIQVHNLWRRVVAAIATVFGKDAEGRALAHEFARRSPDHRTAADDKATDTAYDSSNGALKLGTLDFIARRCNPQQYSLTFMRVDWQRVTCNTVAKNLCVLARGEFVWSKGALHVWNGVYWERDAEGVRLKRLLQHQVHDFYSGAVEQWRRTQIARPPRDGDGNPLPPQNLTKATDRMRDRYQYFTDHAVGTDLVIRQTKVFMTDDTIVWNANPYHVQFRNCLLDLSAEWTDGAGAARHGRLIEPQYEFHNNRCNGVDYRPPSTEAERARRAAAVAWVEAFIRSILPDEATYCALMTGIASMLYRGNRHEKIYFWTGGGRNGKSKLARLLQTALGADCGELLAEWYTAVAKGGSKSPPNVNMANNAERRVLVTFELDDGATFQHKAITQLTGGDGVSARLNHANEEVVVDPGVPIVLANDLPKLSAAVRAAITQRVVVVLFPFTFVRECDQAANPMHRPIDESIGGRIKGDLEVRQAMWDVLLRFWGVYCVGGQQFVESEAMRAEKAVYFEVLDPVKQLLTSVLVRGDEATAVAPIPKLFDMFRSTNGSLSVGAFSERVRGLQYTLKRARVHGYGSAVKCIAGWTIDEAPEEFDEHGRLVQPAAGAGAGAEGAM